MPWFIFFFLVSVLGLIIASYTDLKQRIVSNKLSYSLIAIGLIGHAVLAALKANPLLFIYSAVAAVAGFAFAYVLWKLGVWAGGDVKLFTGIAALNPMNLYIFNAIGVSLGELGKPFGLPLFFVSLFIFSVFAMLPYGVLISLHGLSKREKERKELLKESWIKAKQTIQLSAAVVGFSWLLSFYGITQWLLLPILLALGFIKSKKIKIPLITALFAVSVFNSPIESAANLVMLFAIFFGLYLLIKLYLVSKQILREKKRISGLEEGDIIAESFIEKNGVVQRIAPLEIKTIINYFANNKLQELKEYLQPQGMVIASSRKARGVTEEEIEKLQKLVKEKKVEGSVEVKLSAPFVPALLIAYIVLNVVGDALWAILF